MTSSEPTEERSPLDRALDVGVFAPLGLAFEFRRLVPELAEAGRRHVAFSRSLGRAALRTMARSGTGRSSQTGPAAKPVSSPAVEGYDTMTARQIIDLTSSATPGQRRWMLNRETAGKARKTVLRALAPPG